MDTAPAMVKVSVAFEPEDYAWALERSKALFGRRGLGLYVRKLVREDREFCSNLIEHDRVTREGAAAAAEETAP